MIASQYLGFGIISLMGMLINLQDIKPQYVKPRLEMTFGGYIHNDMPRFNNQPTPKNMHHVGHLKIATITTFFDIIDIEFDMEGFSVKKGFVGGTLGGRWGAKLYLSNNLYIRYRHESNHIGDYGSGLTADGGSYDYIGVTLHIGQNTDRSSIVEKIFY